MRLIIYKRVYVVLMLAVVLWLVIDAVATISSQNLFGEPGTVMERHSHSIAASDLIIAISILLAVFWKRTALLLSVSAPVTWLMYSYMSAGKFIVTPHLIWLPLVASVLALISWWLFHSKPMELE